MPKTGKNFACTACGAEALRWLGKCPRCNEFGTINEVVPEVLQGLNSVVAGVVPQRPARSVSAVGQHHVQRRSSGVGEFDRVLGGGLVAGQVVLLAGEPGVGKSTLLLTVADRFASESGQKVLYLSGEESVEQIAVRARRIGASDPNLLLADETSLQLLIGHVEQNDPVLLIVDSVQTLASSTVEGRAGGVAQVHEVTQALTRMAKSRRMPLLMIGQSTRENSVAGPRALEHLVDTVLTFDGDRHTSLRLLRAIKNRYGPVDEVVCFEQIDAGLKEIEDPSSLFRGQRDVPVPGTCTTVTVEGRRALLAELQALVASSAAPNPRRGVTGLDSARVAMLAAVTERSARIRVSDKDLFVATVGGARISDPASDVAVCLAIASAALGTPMPSDVLAVGEVALSGDIRPVPMLSQRISEAARLGFSRVLVPPSSLKSLGEPPGHLAVVELAHLDSAMHAMRSLPERVVSVN